MSVMTADSPIKSVNQSKPKAPARPKNVKMNMPPPKEKKEAYFFTKEISSNYFEGIVPQEVANNAKGGVLKLASLPARDKKDVMFLKLAQSKYVNDYLTKYMHLDILAGLNDHLKLGLVYGVTYLESMMFQYTTQQNEKEISKSN